VSHTYARKLVINRTLGFFDRMKPVTVNELADAGRKWASYVGPSRLKLPGKCTYEVYMESARPWLKYHSCLVKPVKVRPMEDRLIDFEDMLNASENATHQELRFKWERKNRRIFGHPVFPLLRYWQIVPIKSHASVSIAVVAE
jgi:hypothetical protein